jgi:serine/threonine-protein kinase
MLPKELLTRAAHAHILSPEQEQVFFLRFGEEMEYDDIASELNTSKGACLKRMGQVYEKFGITEGRKGKEIKLRNLLMDEGINISPSLLPPYPGSPIELDSRYYLALPTIETRCCEQIMQPSSLVRIKAPQKSGKTSLMLRITRYAENNGCRIVNLNLKLADREVFQSLNKFLRWFCLNIGKQLGLDNRLDDYWDEELGIKASCQAYLKEYLLTERDNPEQPLVLCIDELDLIFHQEHISQDFLPLLRFFHEESKTSDIWNKVTLLLIYSSEFYGELDINQSPFNVGFCVELPFLTLDQVKELAKNFRVKLTEIQFGQLMDLVAGQPFLVSLAFYHIARGNLTFEEILANATSEQGIYADYLREKTVNLQQKPELIEAFKQIIKENKSLEILDPLAYQLEGMGIVKRIKDNRFISCNLYKKYLTKIFKIY